MRALPPFPPQGIAHLARHEQPRHERAFAIPSTSNKSAPRGTQSAQLARMARHLAFALGLIGVAALLAAGGGCGSSKSCSIAASDYDRSCVQDSDCVGIAEGDLCAENVCTNCANAAINARDQTQYQNDVSSKVSQQRFCPCPDEPVVCNAGTCGIARLAPCPAGLPQTAVACQAEGADCYMASTNTCGAGDCFCVGGAWNCGPTCINPSDAAADTGTDAATDAAADARAE